jgi:NADPH:quinone reductase-like Zn-dependent oxidoreductase
MRAITYSKYGSPEVLTCADVPTPVAGAGQVLVKNYAALVASTDSTARRGTPAFARLYFGLTKPKFPILGTEFAGVVHDLGEGVTRFSKGDRVLGIVGAFGAHAEYVCVSETEPLAIAPLGFDHPEAVALTEGPLTALPFLRDTAGLKAGQHILINGASGSVGSAAVQIAKHMGATVTAVTSTANLELAWTLGADAVIDYTVDDFTSARSAYDVIFDTVAKSSFAKSRKALKPRGIYLTTVPSLAIGPQMLWTSIFRGRRAAISLTGLRAAEKVKADLVTIAELALDGAIAPYIDRRYPLEDAAIAHAYVDTGRKRGNVVLTLWSASNA